jgi:hypothetical protein
MYLERTITKDIESHLFDGKIIVLYGPRRVGKTTLARHISEKYKSQKRVLYLSGDDIDVQKNLSSQSIALIKNYLGDSELVVVDEAQRINNIGINLKIIVDNLPDIQVIATGSSSFELADSIKEPLTGRVWEYLLTPFTVEELLGVFSKQEVISLLENLIKFGFYPEIILGNGQDAQRRLQEITNNYLFKDVLAFEGEKNSVFVSKLLQLLAFQTGNEVSYNELSTKLGVSRMMVEKFVNLLEKSFVIYRLGPFSRNLRNEVGKKHKIFFWDCGIRNGLIQNFSDPSIRPDIGGLWENFCISERIKKLKNKNLFRNTWYWRTYDKKEIDYIEEYDGKLHGFEIKWGKAKFSKYKDFLAAYEGSSLELINRENFWEFVV